MCLRSGGAEGQTRITETTRVMWTASVDQHALAGDPPRRILEGYRVEVYPDAAVGPDGQPMVDAVPVRQLDVRDEPDDRGDVRGPAIRPLLPDAGVYRLYVTAYGPSGPSARVGLPAPIQAAPAGGCAAPLSAQVQEWSRTVAIGAMAARGWVRFAVEASAPVVRVTVRLGDAVVSEVRGDELRGILGASFAVPRQAGSYALTVGVQTRDGCETWTTVRRVVDVTP